MRDDRLLMLVRMAAEAEELEHSERATATRAAGFPLSASPLGTALGWLGSIAAALALLTAWWLATRPAPPPAPLPVEGGLNLTERGHDAGATGSTGLEFAREKTRDTVCDIQSPVLLAVFQHSDGRCDCVVWKPGAFAKDFEQIERADLVNAAWQYRCTDSSELVLVAAVDGPRDLLPLDPGLALELATRLTLQRDECGEHADCYEQEAIDFLSPSVSVRAEAITLASR